MSNRSKRAHGPPSGNTPGKPPQQRSRVVASHSVASSSRKSLFQSDLKPSRPSEVQWKESEVRSLIEYIALYYSDSHGTKNPWPRHDRDEFWEKCAEAVKRCSGASKRSGNACRMKVRKLSEKFPTISEAEEAFGIDYFGDESFRPTEAEEEPGATACSTPICHVQQSEGMLAFSPLRNLNAEEKNLPGSVLDVVSSGFMDLTTRQREQLLVFLLHRWLVSDINPDFDSSFIPRDLLPTVANALKVLFANKKNNLIYDAACCFGKVRPGSNCPRMPLDRMPFGLIAHNLRFFASENVSNLEAPADYKSWYQSMYTLFGNKWAAMHNGPMWSYVENTCDAEEQPSSSAPQSAGDPSTSSDVLAEALQQTFGSLNTYAEVSPSSSAPQTSGDPSSSTDVLAEALQQTFGSNTELLVSEEISPVQLSTTDDHSQPTGEDAPISNLWTGLSELDIREREDATITVRELEELHGIRPSSQGAMSNRDRNPLNAKVNIAGPSTRTIRRMVEKSSYTKGCEIQISALKHLKTIHPSARWWIKADGTDIQLGLRESMRNEWSGDVDWGDGELQRRHDAYIKNLEFVRGIGVKQRRSHASIKADLQKQLQSMIEDRAFLDEGHGKAKETYEAKRKALKVSEESLFALAWDMEGYFQLLEINRKIKLDIDIIVERIDGPVNERGNLPADIAKLKKQVEAYIKDISVKKRHAASHLLLFMISDELRNFKPYAIPVRVVKYKSITDAKLRELKEELRHAMNDCGMTTVGLVTDGEFNSLRTQGTHRPVSVIQLIMDAKAEARKTPTQQIELYLTPIRRGNQIQPAQNHPAVPAEDAIAIYQSMQNGKTFLDALQQLRKSKFPDTYEPHPWVAGKTETSSDVLKSLMAIFIFRKKVTDYASQGVDFRKHLYVPERDENGEPQHEREDHNHVLKRIVGCFRLNYVPNVDTSAFVGAMNNAHTGLTYTALTGKRKQSVPDAEKFLSTAVAEWCKENGFPEEGRVVQLIANWHKASDGRGLSEETRKKYNLAMLDYLLEDWMPWYPGNPVEKDYSTLDPNRPIKKIQGFTREIIVAVTTNIESQEFRRCYGEEKGLPPEHPRAGSTDDVEGIFAFFHELLGPLFDEKAFHDALPKVMLEYTKKCDPELPFFHYTGVNERYDSGLLPSFNQPSGQTERLDVVRISRRADPGLPVINRAIIPQKGQLTVRAAHFRPAEELPPPPAP